MSSLLPCRLKTSGFNGFGCYAVRYTRKSQNLNWFSDLIPISIWNDYNLHNMVTISWTLKYTIIFYDLSILKCIELFYKTTNIIYIWIDKIVLTLDNCIYFTIEYLKNLKRLKLLCYKIGLSECLVLIVYGIGYTLHHVINRYRYKSIWAVIMTYSL